MLAAAGGGGVEQRIALRDGRHIGVAEYGDPRGRPVLWFPGTPGSRWKRPHDDDVARAQRVRLIALERPGFGLSDFQPGRRVIAWPDDVAEVCGALGLTRVAIAGCSGAAPYVAACAYRLPHLVSAAAIIGGVGPLVVRQGVPPRHPRLDTAGTYDQSRWRRLAFAMAREAPWLVGLLVPRDPERLYRQLTRDAPPSDRALLTVPGVWQRQVAGTAEAIRPGLRGFVHELGLAARPWGFSLGEIQPEIHVWHGHDDAAAPLATARRLARALPRCRATFVAGEGHFLHLTRWREILAALIAVR